MQVDVIANELRASYVWNSGGASTTGAQTAREDKYRARAALAVGGFNQRECFALMSHLRRSHHLDWQLRASCRGLVGCAC